MMERFASVDVMLGSISAFLGYAPVLYFRLFSWLLCLLSQRSPPVQRDRERERESARKRAE